MPGHALAYAKLWSRLVLWLFRTICGVQVRVSGLEHLPQSGPALLPRSISLRSIRWYGCCFCHGHAMS